MKKDPALIFWENEYSKNYHNIRKYPNEELARFIGRNYSHIPNAKKKSIKILDVGCGSGNNLNMLITENFKVYGIDLSIASINNCKKLFSSIKNKPNLKSGNMIALPYKNNYFNVITDIFSSYNLNKNEGNIFLKEVNRTLKKNGIFFSYFPSKNSDAWKKENGKNLIDSCTLDGFKRLNSPFYGNNYPFRFLNKKEYTILLKKNNFTIQYFEKIIKSYRFGKEIFEFLIIESKKKYSKNKTNQT